MPHQYNNSSPERRRHIIQGQRLVLSLWRPCPVFDAFSKALMDDLADWRRARDLEIARPPDSWSWDDE